MSPPSANVAAAVEVITSPHIHTPAAAAAAVRLKQPHNFTGICLQ